MKWRVKVFIKWWGISEGKVKKGWTNVKCWIKNLTSSQSEFHFHLIFEEKIRFSLLLFEFMSITVFLDMTPCWMLIYTEENISLTLTVVTEIKFYSAYIKYVGNLLRIFANILPPTRRHIPEDYKLYQQCCKTHFTVHIKLMN